MATRTDKISNSEDTLRVIIVSWLRKDISANLKCFGNSAVEEITAGLQQKKLSCCFSSASLKTTREVRTQSAICQKEKCELHLVLGLTTENFLNKEFLVI